VLRDDFFEIKEDMTPSAKGGGLNSTLGAWSSEFEGGVGGKPESARFKRPGDARGVRSWALSRVEVSSSVNEVATLTGTATGNMLRKSFLRRGRAL
jgi:hypothetical protein